jgi:O-antigen ligase
MLDDGGAGRRPSGGGGVMRALGLGLVLGMFVVVTFGQDMRFAVYGLAALAAFALLPGLVRWAGSAERLLFIALLLSYQVDVAIAYQFRQYKVTGVYGLLISPILIAAAVLVVLRMALAARRLDRPLYVEGRFLGWMAAFFVAGALSRLNALDTQLATFGLFEIVTLALIAIAVADQFTTRDALSIVQRVLAWTLIIQSVLIIVGFATGVQISLVRGAAGSAYGWAESGRFAGTLNAPSVAATTLVVCLLSALTRLYQRVEDRQRLWLYFQLGLGGFALLLTQTRTAWIGLILGGGGILWAAVRRGELRSQRLLSLAGMGLVVILAAWPFIAGRVEANHVDAYETRRQLVDIAVEMIKAHPLLGIGLNSATSQVRVYAALAGAKGWIWIVHNQFLLIWAETGVLGILAFVWLFRIGLQAASRLKRSADPELRNAGLWLFWSLVMLIWALQMDNVSGTATYKLVFLLLGVAVGAARLVPPDAGADVATSAPVTESTLPSRAGAAA